MNHPPARRPADSASILTYRMGVQDANAAGNVHGGWIMKLCDDVAVIAATRHCGRRVVTVAMDGMRFRAPVHISDVVTLRATVNASWTSSMEVGVRVESEDVRSGNVLHTCTSYLTLVALDEQERPLAVPALVPHSEDEKRRFRDAELRREIRLSARDRLHHVLAGP
jgi:acyl-CoA hydrolase